MARNLLVRLRYRYLPEHLLGEILTKRWIDNVVPFFALIVAIAVFGTIVPDFFSASSLTDFGRQIAEFGLIVLGLSIVMMSGGIDLSVASIFSLSVLTALIGINVNDWPVPAAVAMTLALGAACGAINGYLVGYLRLRAFLTTLVTLIIFRSVYDILFLKMSTAIIAGFSDFGAVVLHRRGDGPRPSLLADGRRDHRDRLAHRALAHAPGLAAHGRRRRAPLGPQCRHQGAAHRVLHLCLVGSALRRSPASSSRRGIGSTGADTGIGLEVSGADRRGTRRQLASAAGAARSPRRVMGAMLVLMLTNAWSISASAAGHHRRFSASSCSSPSSSTCAG